jgi:shikimate dehydrogenase
MNIQPSDYPDQDVYAVIGNPIAHSKSPQIHHLFAQQTEQNMQYGLLFSEVDDFEKTVQEFFAAGGKGLNVTVPFKNKAFAMCDQLSSYAQAAGVVNILWMENGKLMGDNSDGLGLVRDLMGESDHLKGCSVLILGAGGAVQGVILPLIKAEVASIVIVNRTFEKALELVHRFTPEADLAGVHLGALESHWIENLDEPFDIVINGTSTGLTSDSPLTNQQANHLAMICETKDKSVLSYDMVYGKPTVFMQQMQEHGFVVKDGLGMLVEQAAVAFQVWRKLPASIQLDTKRVLEKLRVEL